MKITNTLIDMSRPLKVKQKTNQIILENQSYKNIKLIITLKIYYHKQNTVAIQKDLHQRRRRGEIIYKHRKKIIKLKKVNQNNLGTLAIKYNQIKKKRIKI